MSKMNIETASILAAKFRQSFSLSATEPLSMKTLVRMSSILMMYRPLEDALYGMSMKTADSSSKFILLNSNSTVGRQNFTIAHELYHLYFEEHPQPHFCRLGFLNDSERAANMFAGALLMPKEGLLQFVDNKELVKSSLSLSTILNLEQIFGVSHSMLLIRLKELKLIGENDFNNFNMLHVKKEAAMRGLDLSIYNRGNEGLIISDFGQKARQLYESERISEGHYMELLNMIGYGGEETENSSVC